MTLCHPLQLVFLGTCCPIFRDAIPPLFSILFCHALFLFVSPFLSSFVCRMSVQSTPTPADPPLMPITASLPVGRSPSPRANSPTQSLSSQEPTTSWDTTPHSVSGSEHVTPGTASSIGISPQQLVAIQEEEHTSSSLPGSPNLRGSAGKRVGGMDMALSTSFPPFLHPSLYSSPRLIFSTGFFLISQGLRNG